MRQELLTQNLLMILALLHLMLVIHVVLEQVNGLLRHILENLVLILRLLNVGMITINVEKVCFFGSTFGIKVYQCMEVVIAIAMQLLANYTPCDLFLLV